MTDIHSYYRAKITDDDIDNNIHREAVGGLWGEIGELSFNFLMDRANIRPDMKILDFGSGCFRCGIRLIEYLNPGNYYAIDLSEDLIAAGFAELRKSGLENKLPQKNIHITEYFDAKVFNVEFDIVLAQSLWTHLPLNHIQRCLAMVENVLSADGSFYTTFFLCPDNHDLLESHRHEPGGIVTYRHRNPYHCRLNDFSYLIKQIGSQLKMQFIGDWNHPRNQKMLCFKKKRE